MNFKQPLSVLLSYGMQKWYGLFLILMFCLIDITAAQPTVIDSGSCKRVDQIIIEGRRKTRDGIILREISVQEGDCLMPQQLDFLLEQNVLRLNNLRLFTKVNLQWRNSERAAAALVLYIQVNDRFPIMPEPEFEFADRNVNVWWTEQNADLRRLNIGLTLNHTNFRGNREVVSVTAEVGYTQKFGLSYAIPFIDKQKKHGIGASIFGLQNREIPYDTRDNKLAFYRSNEIFMLRRFDAAFWYTYRPAYATTHIAKLNYHHYWISDTVATYLNPQYLGKSAKEEDVLHFQYRYEYNGVDNWNYALTGNRFIAQFDQKLAVTNRYWQTSLNLHYDNYKKIAPKWFLANTIRARISTPQHQPYIFRQNLGYEFDYIRGYEYYVMDGGAFALLRSNIKRELLNVQIKLPIKYIDLIPIRIYGKLYGDVGAGYNRYILPTDKVNNRLLYAGGFGLDIITLYDIKVRIEYTINHLGEKDLYLHRNGE